MSMTPRRKSDGFTLVEMVIMMAMIAIAAAFILPAIFKAKRVNEMPAKFSVLDEVSINGANVSGIVTWSHMTSVGDKDVWNYRVRYIDAKAEPVEKYYYEFELTKKEKPAEKP
jgi:prepilin-type N-terminal cleavage/methylation domain-containing protein